MASRNEKQRVLSGSLNLLPPSDKVPDGDAVLLDNWRVDQVGQLRSRRGAILEAGPVGSGKFHTLARAGNNRYSGIGTELRWGAGADTVVASGFDGNPLGIAFAEGAAWVMNRAKQLRVDMATARKWGIDAPATAPVASAGAQNFISIEGWNGSGEVPDGMQIWQQDSSGAAHVNAWQVLRTVKAGTVAATLGSPVLIGTGTNWDQSMVGLNITITGPLPNGNQFELWAGVLSVDSPTQLTMSGDFPYASADGLSYEIEQRVAMGEFDALNFQEGAASLKMNATTPGLWGVTDNLQVTRNAAADTRNGDVAADDDQFRVWLRVDNPAAVDWIRITLWSGGDAYLDGQQRNVPYLPADIARAYCTIPGSALGALANSWTLLELLRCFNWDYWNQQGNNIPMVPYFKNIPPDDAMNFMVADPQALADLLAQEDARRAMPHFTEIYGGRVETNIVQVTQGPDMGKYAIAGGVPLPGIDWSAVSGIQVEIHANTACTINLDFACFVGNVGGSLTGSGEYYVSFANADGEDSNPSPVSNTVAVQTQSVALTQIPISPDPQVTERWIYRVGFGSTQALLVGKISDNVTTQFFDTTATTDAQNEGVVMPLNRTPPPPARGVMGPFLGKLIAFRSDDHPARYFWTPSGQPWFFPGADDSDIGQWEDAGSDDDELLAMTNHTQMLLLYKQRSLWRLPGDPNNVDPELADATVGLVGEQAVVNAGMLDYFVGPEGVYLRTYDYKQKISPELDPIFKGDWVQLADGEFMPPMSSDKSGMVLELVNDRLYLSYTEQGQVVNNVTLICQIPGAVAFGALPTYRWSRMRMSAGVPGTGGFTALRYEGGPYFLMGGATAATPNGGGCIYHLEIGTDDAGQFIHVAWQSRFSDQGLPDHYKRYADLEVDFTTAVGAESSPSTLLVCLVYDNGTKVPVGELSNLGRTTAVFWLNDYRAKNAAVRIEGDVNTTCIIYGTYLHWYPEERVGETFDSGFFDLGQAERVKQVDYLELYATGNGQTLTRQLFSDLPGNTLLVRDNGILMAPNGRGNVRSRLAAIVEGRNFRFTLVGAPFQAHRFRVRQRVIGEYIDSTAGEFYQSPEFSVAPGRVGELKDLMLDYDTTGGQGPGQVSLWSDLPGNALAIARAMPLPMQVRAPRVFAFEGAADTLPCGQLFRVQLFPPPGGVLRLHGRAQFRARVLGVYFDGTRGERWETQPLDLFGGIAMFREVAVVAQTAGPMLFEMLVELPGGDLRTVASFNVNTPATTAGRAPIYARVPGTVKGQLQKFRLSGPYVARLFEVRVFGRGLGTTETEWTWRDVPLERTPDEWANIQMPVRATPEEFTWVDLPADAIE